MGTLSTNVPIWRKISSCHCLTEAVSTIFAVGVGEEWPVDPANPKAADNRGVQCVNLGLVK